MSAVPEKKKQFADPDAVGGKRPSLVKRVAGGFGLKIASMGSGFLLTWIIAKFLGPVGSGQFAIAQTGSVFGATVGKLGLDNTVVRFISTHDTEEDKHQINPLLRSALLVCTVVSFLTAIGLYFGAEWIAPYMVEDPRKVRPEMYGQYAELIRLVSFAIVPFALSTLVGQALIGLKRTNEGIIVQLLIMPLCGSLLAVGLIPKWGLHGAVYAYTISAFLALVYAGYKWQKRVGKGGSGLYDIPTLLKSCLPLFQMTMVQFVLKWSSVFLIAKWATVQDVGVFNVALRTAFLLTIILSSVNASVSPMFTQHYLNGEIDELGHLARKCAQAMAAFAAVPLLIFLVMPNFVMGVYGKGFAHGGLTLVVLAVGQYVNVITGSVQQLLMMTGREKLVGRVYSGICVPYLILMYLLTPPYGALGAAIATASMMIAQNLICAYLVKRELGIWTLPSLRDMAEVPAITFRQVRKKILRRPAKEGA